MLSAKRTYLIDIKQQQISIDFPKEDDDDDVDGGDDDCLSGVWGLNDPTNLTFIYNTNNNNNKMQR